MNYEYRKLTPDEHGALCALFKTCFAEDTYYTSRFFSGPQEKSDSFYRSAFSFFLFLIRSGNTIGAYHDGQLTAFILFFDFESLKARHNDIFLSVFGNGKSEIENRERFEKFILQHSSSRTIYIPVLGVHPDHRRRGIAGHLLKMLRASYLGSYSLASDISNEKSLPLYEKNGFIIQKVEDHYYYVCSSNEPAENCIWKNGSQVSLFLPSPPELFEDIFSELDEAPIQTEIDGFQVDADSQVPAFLRDPAGGRCKAYLLRISYRTLLRFQRYINLAHYDETFIEHESLKTTCVLYARTERIQALPLYNPLLREMVRGRKQEWDLIPDVQVMCPMRYEDAERLTASASVPQPMIAELLKNLEYRTFYELGDQGKDSHIGERTCSRIRRIYLGQVMLSVHEEPTLENFYNNQTPMIGSPAAADLFIAIDSMTKCASLCINLFSIPFLLSHFMDNVIRKKLILHADGKMFIFFDYLKEKFGIELRGNPKIFLTIPEEKDILSPNQTAALLMSETIYDKDVQLGQYIDPDVLNKVHSESGMGQYDRAFVLASSNVVIQFSSSFRMSVFNRAKEEAITLFYIELLIFEEAALFISIHDAERLIFAVKKAPLLFFLRRTYHIYSSFLMTSFFQNLFLSYPSSRASIKMLRNSFEIKQIEEQNKRVGQELHDVFETRKDIADRFDFFLLNFILLPLTLVESLSILCPCFFSTLGIKQTGILVMLIFTVSLLIGKMLSLYIFIKQNPPK